MDLFFLILISLLIFTLGIPLLITIVGLFLGIMLACYHSCEALLKASSPGPPPPTTQPQRPAGPPAYVLPPFGPGWRAIPVMLTTLLQRAYQLKERWLDHAHTLHYFVRDRFFLLQYPVWLIIAGLHGAARIQYLPVLICALLICLLSPLALAIWAMIAIPAIIILACLNAFFRSLYRITLTCPACYQTMPLPVYLCPHCQREHPRLQPNRYGVLWHRCRGCHHRLPTLAALGRSTLESLCPHCSHAIPAELGTGPALHLALVGSSGSGKTSYLTTALRLLQAKQPRKISIIAHSQHSNTPLELPISENLLSPTSEITPLASLLKIKTSPLSVPRLIYCYDAPGEAFQSSYATASQCYYRYCDDLLFFIDPLTLPTFVRRHAAEIECLALPPRPNYGVTVQVYERMMQAFEQFAGFNVGKRYKQPVAVIVTHTDLLDLENEIGLPAADHRVREFLCAHDLDNLVRDLEQHFAHVRYFSCSLPPSDTSLAVGVEESLNWLLRHKKFVCLTSDPFLQEA